MLSRFMDVCYPPVCLHCYAEISGKDLWLCGNCHDRLSFMPEQQCPRCGSPAEEDACSNCAENAFVFTQAKSVFLFEGAARSLVHSLKYEGFTHIAGWFANQMYKTVLGEMPLPGVEYVTAIPLHRVKRRERGFNQSGLIGKALAEKLKLPYTDALLTRKANTMSQTMLDGVSRKKNMRGAFRTGRLSSAGKSILIIDDVFTTGSTVNEAGKVLLDGGAEHIYVLTACHGI
jgi:ComF family protein